MCGIIKRPTRRKDFDPVRFPKLSLRSVVAIATACEDVHIPHAATELVLQFANEMANKKNFVLEVLPFAIYEDGKRIVSKESMEAEQAIMHLAMAGSVRRIINEELASVGLLFELGHCCDIEMWEKSREQEAVRLSHDRNVYRADRLRALKGASEVVLSGEVFTQKADGNSHLLRVMQALPRQQLHVH